eukprot:TRINITY_DN8761_c0_g1_i1.p2 TRINITY_DN8761_c0_g1~~TRINITY_DN8761_c0_g1_i1.p2  ORF type:complete len:105 (-),score=24.66 TRINITY_DN8761_c0_g1_i1:48-362(-)
MQQEEQRDEKAQSFTALDSTDEVDPFFDIDHPIGRSDPVCPAPSSPGSLWTQETDLDSYSPLRVDFTDDKIIPIPSHFHQARPRASSTFEDRFLDFNDLPFGST